VANALLNGEGIRQIDSNVESLNRSAAFTPLALERAAILEVEAA
jgi:hypothetical protein